MKVLERLLVDELDLKKKKNVFKLNKNEGTRCGLNSYLLGGRKKNNVEI